MFQKVIEYLDKRGWRYSNVKEDGSIFISLSHDNGTYHCQIYAKPDTDIFAFISFLGTRCPYDKMESVLKLINLANNNLLYGNFEINAAGDIKHRTSIYLENINIADEIIEGIIMRNIFSIDSASPIFSKIMFGGMTNEDAYFELFPYLKKETIELDDSSTTLIEDPSDDNK